MAKQEKGHKSKVGRWIKKPSNKNYPARRLRNKLGHIMRSCGSAFAEAWAAKNGMTNEYLKVSRRVAQRYADRGAKLQVPGGPNELGEPQP